MLVALGNVDGLEDTDFNSYSNMFDFILAEYGCMERSIKTIFEGLGNKKLASDICKPLLYTEGLDDTKTNLNIIEFFRFLIQVCT